MTRKKWGILLLVLAMATVIAVGCGGSRPQPQEPPKAEEPSAEEPADEEQAGEVSLEDGVYVGVGQGYGGEIEIEVTIAGGTITNIEVVDHKETESIGGAAFAELIEAAKEAQGADFDAVTSATKTTQGFIEALEDVLSQASN